MDITSFVKINQVQKGMIFKRKSDNKFYKLMNILSPDVEENEFIYIFKGFSIKGKQLFKKMFSKDLQGNIEIYKMV